VLAAFCHKMQHVFDMLCGDTLNVSVVSYIWLAWNLLFMLRCQYISCLILLGLVLWVCAQWLSGGVSPPSC